MAGLMGFAAKLYLTISASPTLVEHIGDVTVPRKNSEVEVTTRSDGGFQTFARGLRELGVQFFLQKRKGNTVYNAFRDADRNGTDVVITVCDGLIATVGTEKLTMTCAILDFSEEQKLNDKIGHTVVLKPTWSDTIPVEATVAS